MSVWVWLGILVLVVIALRALSGDKKDNPALKKFQKDVIPYSATRFIRTSVASNGDKLFQYKGYDGAGYTLREVKDPFDDSVFTQFDIIGDYQRPALMVTTNNGDLQYLDIGGIIKNEKAFLLIACYQKDVKPNQGDKLLFAFEDGQKFDLALVQKPHRLEKTEMGVMLANYAELEEQQLTKLVNIKLKAYRLVTADAELTAQPDESVKAKIKTAFKVLQLHIKTPPAY